MIDFEKAKKVINNNTTYLLKDIRDFVSNFNSYFKFSIAKNTYLDKYCQDLYTYVSNLDNTNNLDDLLINILDKAFELLPEEYTKTTCLDTEEFTLEIA